MAKKKNPVGLLAASPLATNQDSEYGIGTWAGSPHYQCKLCQFDTLLGLDVMLTHLVERHSSEAALNTLFPSAPVNGVDEIKELEDGTNQPE